MVRVKFVIRRIEDNGDRSATFSRRRDGIIKKAFELAVLCDNDIAMIMFGPNGKLICFPCSQRLEDFLIRYASLPDYCRTGTRTTSAPNKEEVLNRLGEIQRNREIAARLTRIEDKKSVRSKTQELQREVSRLSHQLEVVEARLRNYQPDPDTITSIKQAEWCERFLTAALNRINEIKEELLRNHVFSQGQGFGQASLDGEDETFPFKVDDVALLPEIPLHPINISIECNDLFRASDVVIDKTIDEGNIVGPQAPVCQVNRQVDVDWPLWLQDYTSSELLAMSTIPTFPEMEDVMREGVVAGMPSQEEEVVMREGVVAGMPSQEEEAGPGADDDDDDDVGCSA